MKKATKKKTLVGLCILCVVVYVWFCIQQVCNIVDKNKHRIYAYKSKNIKIGGFMSRNISMTTQILHKHSAHNCLSEIQTLENYQNKVENYQNKVENYQNDGPMRNTTEVLPISEFQWPLQLDLNRLVTQQKIKGFNNICKHPINKFAFEFIVNPIHKCKSGEGFQDIFLLFMVKSSYGHSTQRDAVRMTWGNESYLTFYKVQTVFTIGRPHKSSTDADGIALEISTHNDILQVNIADTYYNNTLKTVAMINWVAHYCHAKYVMFVDDDMFVSPEMLVMLLSKLPVYQRKKVYMGHIFEQSKPHRIPGNKWFIPINNYPYEFYPPFVSAGSMIFSIDFVHDLQIAMKYVKYFKLDDIYVSFVAKKLHIKPRSVPQMYNQKLILNEEGFEQMISGHGYIADELRSIWSKRKGLPHILPNSTVYQLKITRKTFTMYLLMKL